MERSERQEPLGIAAQRSALEVTRQCPACGRNTAHKLRYCKNRSDILQCSICGLGRAEPTNFDPATYYTADYFAGGHADGYSDYLGAEGVLRHEFAKTINFIRRFHRAGKLLEIGCAYGFFLQEARRYFDCYGIELARDAAEHCRHAGLNVQQGIADEAHLSRIGQTDVIVLLDVIEHLTEPRETLSLCSKYLNPGGIIVLTTGNFNSIIARLMGVNWRLMTPPQHLWYFTPESLKRLSTALGLSVMHLDHPWKLVPASLILFQLRRMISGRPRNATSAGSRLGIPVNLFDAMRVVLRKNSA